TVAALERAGAARRVLAAGQRLRLGEATVTVLSPPGVDDAAAPLAGENDHSLVLRLDWRGIALLLTGDLTARGEEGLLVGRAPLAATVLKVGHHGSRGSTGAAFVGASQPRIAVVSVGARNPFRHPAPEVLDRLAVAGARLYRTDRDGAVIVETDGVRLWVTRWASRRRDELPVAPGRPRPLTHERRAEDTTASGKDTGGRDDARGTGGTSSRMRARTARAAAPAPRDRDGCPGRAPSLPGSS